MSDDDNNNNSSVFSLEHFGLFLASHLTGGGFKELERRLESSISSLPSIDNKKASNTAVSVPVYWRSPLLHTVDPSCFVPSKVDNDDDDDDKNEAAEPPKKMDLIFMDVTVVFRTRLAADGAGNGSGSSEDDGNDKDDEKTQTVAKPQSSISVMFGAFLRRSRNKKDDRSNSKNSNDHYYYLQSPPATTSMLDDHMNEHGLALEDTISRSIANPMIRALHRLSRGSKVKAKYADNTQHLRKVQIPLFYEEDDGEVLTDPSYLTISNRNGPISSPLESHVASTMLCSILAQQEADELAKKMDKERQQKEQGDNQVGDDEEDKASSSSNSTRLGKKDSIVLLSKYEEWKEQAAKWLLDCQARAKQREIEKKKQSDDDDDGENVSPTKQSPSKGSNENNNNKQPESKQKSSDGNNNINNSKPKKARPPPQFYNSYRVGGKKKHKIARFAN